MSKKSRSSSGPGDIGGPLDSDDEGAPNQSTVVDGETLRLDSHNRSEPAPAGMTTNSPDGTMVSRVDPPKAQASNSAAPKSAPPKPDAPKPMAAAPVVKAPVGKGASPQSAAQPGASQSGDAAYPSTGVLGLDIVMRWSGEMHKARFFPTPQAVTIGEEGLFPLPDDLMGGKKLDTLVVPDSKDQFSLLLDNPAIKGQIIIGSDVYAVVDVKAGRTPLPKDRVPLTAKTHVFIEFGEFTFVLSRGAVPPPAKPSLWSAEDSLLVMMFGLAALLLLGPLVASFALTDPRDRRAKTYVEELEKRVVEIQIIEDKKEEEKKEEENDKKEDEKKDEKPTAPVEAPVTVQQVKIEKAADDIKKQLDAATPDEREAKKQEIVTKEVDKATLAVDAALAGLPSTKLAADLGSGADAAEVAAAGAGAVVLDTGSGPSEPGGRRAPGVGGGNDTGKQVATGLEKQDAGGAGPKLNAEVKAKDQKVIRVGGGSAGAEGELPPEVIKKVLSDKAGAVKACYQKELQSNPDLAGSIKVKFVINPGGQVVGVKIESSNIDNSKVEECISALIKSMRFPQAKGGGITTVNKTFTFKSN